MLDLLLVAPFWDDVDITKAGSTGRVLYESHNSGSAVQEMSSFISEQVGSEFVGRWMLLAEWRNVTGYDHEVTFVSTVASAGSMRLFCEVF